MSLSSPDLHLSGQRFAGVYQLSCAPDDVERIALDIAIEQTIEFPLDALPEGQIRAQILGRIESIEAISAERHRVRISYPDELLAGEMTQVANVLYGNVALKPGIRLVAIEPSAGLLACGPGPRFGLAGLRERLGVHDRPIIATAIKPVGLSADALAAMAGTFARGGIDLIKDDHGLTDQRFCRFEDRVARCVDAVAEANAQTDHRAAYVANVTAPGSQLFERAHRAKELGADGVMVAPGHAGLDGIAELAADDALGLPILAHPTWWGHLAGDASRGIAHRVLYGDLLRLAGADGTIFACHGGRFAEGLDDTLEVVAGCREPWGELPPIAPVPAGGIRLGRLPELLELFGREVMLLVGGALHTDHDDLEASCEAFCAAVEQLLV